MLARSYTSPWAAGQEEGKAPGPKGGCFFKISLLSSLGGDKLGLALFKLSFLCWSLLKYVALSELSAFCRLILLVSALWTHQDNGCSNSHNGGGKVISLVLMRQGSC